MHPLLAASLVNSLSSERAAAAGRRAARLPVAQKRPTRRRRRHPRATPPTGPRSSVSARSTATAPRASSWPHAAADHAVLVAEVDGSVEAALALDGGVPSPTRSAPARCTPAALPARPPARRRRAAPPPLAPRRAAPAHVVTSGRCCRPARPPRAPSRPGSGWRGRRRCCAAAPPASACRSRCAPRGPTRRWWSSPTPPTCARCSPPRPTCDRRRELELPRAVRRPELDPRPRRRRRTCASAS